MTIAPMPLSRLVGDTKDHSAILHFDANGALTLASGEAFDGVSDSTCESRWQGIVDAMIGCSASELLQRARLSQNRQISQSCGRSATHRAIVSPLLDEDGQVQSCAMILTPRKELYGTGDGAQRALSRSTRVGVWTLQCVPPIDRNAPASEQSAQLSQGILVDCNDAFARMLGANHATDLIGKRCPEIFGPEEASSFAEGWVAIGFELDTAELELPVRSGGTVAALLEGASVFDGDMLMSLDGTLLDITSTKEVAKES